MTGAAFVAALVAVILGLLLLETLVAWRAVTR